MFPRPRLLCNGREDRARPGDRLIYDDSSGRLAYLRRRQQLQLLLDGAGGATAVDLAGYRPDAAWMEATAHFLARLGQLDGVLLRHCDTSSGRLSVTIVR